MGRGSTMFFEVLSTEQRQMLSAFLEHARPGMRVTLDCFDGFGKDYSIEGKLVEPMRLGLTRDDAGRDMSGVTIDHAGAIPYSFTTRLGTNRSVVPYTQIQKYSLKES